MRKIYLFIYLFIIISNTSSSAQVDVITNKENIEDVEMSIEILTDSSGTLSFQDVVSSTRFKKAKQTVPNLDVTPFTHWLKVQIKNETDAENFLLEVSNPVLDVVDFYTVLPDGKVEICESGAIQKITARKYTHQNFIFNISIPQGKTQTFFLKVKSGNLIVIPIFVGTSKAFFESHVIKELVFGIYIGIIIVMFLYNLFIYFTVRDKNYLYYVTYIIFVGITQVTLQGYTYKYLWPDSPWFANQSIVLFAALAGIAIALFSRNFLRVKKHVPLLNKGLSVIIIAYAIAIPLRALGYNNLSYKIVDTLAGVICLYSLIIAIVISIKGYRPAKFFLLAWSIFLIGVVIFVLRNFGVLPYNNFTNYTMPFGNAIEVILLSFALADRINILKQEKEESQKQALGVLKENKRIITEQNVFLETNVKARTSELEASNKNLKETQTQLVNAEKMASLGQLTAGIAHEINNPINFVISNITPLKRDVENILHVLDKYSEIKGDHNLHDKIKEINDLKEKLDVNYLITEIDLLLKGINEGAYRTAEIVKGLQTFARLDENELKKIDIHEGIISTLTLLNSNLKKGNIDVIKNFDKQLPHIECYPGKLNQVFMNLLINAIHAIMDKKDVSKEGTITIKTRADNNHVIISIGDNGIGIPEKNKNKIFEPFFTTKQVGAGTGLGLSIVYNIIKNHNGEIKVESEEGKGTTFVLSLPIVQEGFEKLKS